MLQVCWSPKGGSGTSVVAAAMAVQAAAAGHEALLVDLAGDHAAILGVTVSEGIGDWCAAADDVGPDALRSLEVDVAPGLRLLGLGVAPPSAWCDRRLGLAAALFQTRLDPVVLDAGGRLSVDLPAGAEEIAVIRACYLGVRRLVDEGRGDSRVVLIEEPGRALSHRDVASAVGRVDAALPWDPAVARVVDAGLLATRVPRSLRPLRVLLAATPRSGR